MIKALDAFVPGLFEYRPYSNPSLAPNASSIPNQKGGRIVQTHRRKKIKTGIPNMYYYNKQNISKTKPDNELKYLLDNDVIDGVQMDKIVTQVMYKSKPTAISTSTLTAKSTSKSNKPKNNLNKITHTRKIQPRKIKMSRKIKTKEQKEKSKTNTKYQQQTLNIK